VVALVLFLLIASTVVTALGFLLLLPLQTMAGLQQDRSLNQPRSRRIQRDETKLKALRCRWQRNLKRTSGNKGRIASRPGSYLRELGRREGEG
jgi:hypothetical protein